MKIALYGNVCNNMYAITKALRLYTDYDVHLFLPENLDFNNRPENDDPELLNNYPAWIHRGKEFNLGSPFRFWKRSILSELNKFDLVILSSLSVALAPFLKRPKIFFFATGGDLTVLPFKEIHRTLLYSGKSTNFKPLVYEWAQRRGIRKIDKILTQPFFPFVNALNKLGVEAPRIATSYFPIIIDTDKFQYRENARQLLSTSVQDELDKFKFKIFHPSRIVTNSHSHLVETGQWKQNDMLVKAFADFVKRNDISDAALYFIERDYGRNFEIDNLKQLSKDLGIEKYVLWLSPPDKKGFTRDELVNIYSQVDIVSDDYGAGWFGSICVEGFSCKKPVVSFVDEVAMKQIYPWHPFLSSNTKEGNSQLIEKCYFDKEFSIKQGELGRKWALEFHSPVNAGKLYVKEFHKLLTAIN